MCTWFYYDYMTKRPLKRRVYNILFAHIKPTDKVSPQYMEFAKAQLAQYNKPKDGRCMCRHSDNNGAYMHLIVMNELRWKAGLQPWNLSARWLLKIDVN